MFRNILIVHSSVFQSRIVIYGSTNEHIYCEYVTTLGQYKQDQRLMEV